MFDPNYVIPTGMDISIDGACQNIFATSDGCYRLEGQTRPTTVLHYKELNLHHSAPFLEWDLLKFCMKEK